ncbi:MAG: GNAT family N-acetyltransferase [Bacteroidetes bacterium]|nr:GNAT family N-acetyltransferase [Bacteroidota bacterium]
MSTPSILLKKTEPQDLHTLFEFQTEQEAIHLAAFTPKDPHDKQAYLDKYTPFLSDPTKIFRTIYVNDEIAGSISQFILYGDAEITYWIDRKYWGQGIATAALRELVQIVSIRPLYGRVAFDNIGSQKVLEKCGFVKTGTDKGFANARQEEIEEFIYELSA